MLISGRVISLIQFVGGDGIGIIGLWNTTYVNMDLFAGRILDFFFAMLMEVAICEVCLELFPTILRHFQKNCLLNLALPVFELVEGCHPLPNVQK